MLTKELFDKIKPGEIIRITTTKFHDLQIADRKVTELTFVVVKGQADDWAIYYQFSSYGPEFIRRQGAKLQDKENIQSIMPCTPEVLKLYRR